MNTAEAESSCSQTDSVFCDWCKMKSGGGLKVKVAVVVRVKREEEKKEKEEARTAALGGAERLNKA
jgi:hypothetical protein